LRMLITLGKCLIKGSWIIELKRRKQYSFD
jgi:hypothetical protein